MKFTKKQLKFLEDIFTPRCCHVTGEHDSLHFEDKKYVCDIQKREAFDRGRELLGFGQVTIDDPIPGEDCYWCNLNDKGERDEDN
jgi:hypothetical protein